MEHANHIPWDLLTNHLQYVFADDNDQQRATDLFPCSKEDQGTDLNNFVKIFGQSIEEFSGVERKKYPDTYDPPEADTILLDDDLVKRISPALHRIHLHQWLDNANHDREYFYLSQLCSHEKHDAKCTCPLRYEDRKASSFLRQKTDHGCFDFYKVNNLGYLTMEIVKTLMVSGDMEPILRTCVHPENDLQTWRSLAVCDCGAELSDLGWEHAYERALEAFICLNVLYCFPEIRGRQSHEQDYRRTSCYQELVRNSAISGTEAIRPLHIDFFGIREGQFSDNPRARKDGPFTHLGERLQVGQGTYPYGIKPIHDFLEFENTASHLPNVSEVTHVSWLLTMKGLPVEISSRIMELADYEPRRRLKVPHDPFHEENNAELEIYLSTC